MGKGSGFVGKGGRLLLFGCVIRAEVGHRPSAAPNLAVYGNMSQHTGAVTRSDRGNTSPTNFTDTATNYLLPTHL